MKITLSKNQWKYIGKMAGWIKTAAQVQTYSSGKIIKRDDGYWVIIDKETMAHIQKAHGTEAWGKGSIFTQFPDLDSVAQNAQFSNEIFYPIQGAAGYNLVLPTQDAMKLPDAKSLQTTKEEDVGGTGKLQDMSVPAVSTSAPLSEFATNEAWAIILTAKPQFLAEDLKNDPEILEKVKEGKLKALVTAFPGRKDVPKITDWKGNWVVVIPQK